MALSDKCYQLVGLPKTAIHRLKRAFPLRRVAAESEDILHSARYNPRQDGAQFVPCGPHASEMRHRLDAGIPLDFGDDLDRFLSGRTASAIRNRYEAWLELL